MEGCTSVGNESRISVESDCNLSVGSPDGTIESPVVSKKSTASYSSDGGETMPGQHSLNTRPITYDSVFCDDVKQKTENAIKDYSDVSYKIKTENSFPPGDFIGRNINYGFGYREQFDVLNNMNDFSNKTGMNNTNKLIFNSNPFSPVSTAQMNTTHRSTISSSGSGPSVPIQFSRANRSDVQFRCNMCGKCFTHSCKLQTHQRYHNGEKPFKCTECGKSFTQRAGLMQHHRLHTGEKPFKCQDCGKCFTQLAGAVQHQRTHSGEKPFGCTECGKAFSQRAGLIQHERLHTGEKPFNCLECGKCFTQLAGLNQHMRTHSGEKPFKCHMCGKCYTQHAGLMAHMKSHTSEGMVSPSMLVRDGIHINHQNGSSTPSVSSQSGDELNGKATPSSDSFPPFSPVNVPNYLPPPLQLQQSQKSRNDEIPSAPHVPNLLPNMQFMHGGSAINMFNPPNLQGYSSNKYKMQGEGSGLMSPTMERGAGGSSMMSPGVSNTQKKSKIDKPFKCNICSKAYTQFAGLMIHQASHQPSQNNNLSTTISAAVENIFTGPINPMSAEASIAAASLIGPGGAMPFIPSSLGHNPINMAKGSNIKSAHTSGSATESGQGLSHPALNASHLLMNVLP